MKKKTLNVIRTNNKTLCEKWGFYPNLRGQLFIRCDKKANVNWEKAPVYGLQELEQRGNYNILN